MEKSLKIYFNLFVKKVLYNAFVLQGQALRVWVKKSSSSLRSERIFLPKVLHFKNIVKVSGLTKRQKVPADWNLHT